MRMLFHGTFVVAALAVSAISGGCGTQQSDDQTPVNVSGPPPATEEHGHKGPHGGHVIELGRSHEYHAELVDDEQAESVTVYILDKDMKELPIEEQTLTLNLMVDSAAKTFELSAAGATGGKTSRFDSADKAVFEALHEHEASGKLRVTINGTPYSGVVEHHDDHGDDEGDPGQKHDHSDK